MRGTMEIEFDVKITANVLYDYMLHHTYKSFAGVLGTAVGVFMIAGFAMTGQILYLIAGLVVLLYQPGSLFLKSKQQALSNPAFKNPLHYRITEEGVEVSQGEVKEFQKWEDMYKATSTGHSIILYTSRINASIFPRKDLGDQLPGVIQAICSHMPAGAVHIRG